MRKDEVKLMARPSKQGVDYFPLDVHMDDKIKFVEIKYKLEGFAIVIKLMQRIYSHGYWCKWTEDELLLFSDEIRADMELVRDVVNECLERDIFNRELYDKHNILTSKGIQKRYKEIVRRRKDVEVTEEYLLIDDIVTSSRRHQDDIKKSNRRSDDGKSEQSKVKESKVNKSKQDIPYSEIVSFLNEKTGKKYRPTTPKTQSLIQARWNEGFRLEDFERVIELKCKDWLDDEKMSRYLRPETLFGTKFESYLNESIERDTPEPKDSITERLNEVKGLLELGEEYWRKFETIEQYEALKKELRELEQLRTH